MWSVPSRDYVKRLTARLGKNRGGQSFFTTKRPPYGSSRTTGRALILYGVQKKNAGFSLQLGACGDQSLAVLVALVLGEVLHEAAGQIFLGFWKNMLLLSGGLFLCFPAAVYLMIKGRKARNTESIPFLPFVFPVGLGVLFL